MTFLVPWDALLGGMLLGLSAALLLLFNGKIAGISGAINGLLQPKKNELNWRIAFLGGMVLSVYITEPFGITLPDVSHYNILLVSLAGLLVGFGTRLGNGCTSGHGIIGMGRFSKRSIVATITFMLSAILVVFLRHLMGAL